MNADDLVGLEQPDQQTCGPSTLVAARMVLDPAYRPADFAAEVLALHRVVTSAAASRVPWPRALGTPPWAVAAQLERWTGEHWRIRVVRFGDTPDDRLEVLYLGDRWLPRHVVLDLGDGRFYDPARASVGPLRSRWTTRWFRVAPSGQPD